VRRNGATARRNGRRNGATAQRLNGAAAQRCATVGATVAASRFFFGAKIRQAATSSKILTFSNPCRRFAFNGWGGFAIAIFLDSGVAAFWCIGSAA